MDILLAFIFGAAVGLIGHFALPGREFRGAALLPVLGALAGGAAWAALTWAAWSTADPWIWIASISAAVAVTLVVGVLLTKARRTHDARERARLRVA